MQSINLLRYLTSLGIKKIQVKITVSLQVHLGLNRPSWWNFGFFVKKALFKALWTSWSICFHSPWSSSLSTRSSEVLFQRRWASGSQSLVLDVGAFPIPLHHRIQVPPDTLPQQIWSTRWGRRCTSNLIPAEQGCRASSLCQAEVVELEPAGEVLGGGVFLWGVRRESESLAPQNYPPSHVLA